MKIQNAHRHKVRSRHKVINKKDKVRFLKFLVAGDTGIEKKGKVEAAILGRNFLEKKVHDPIRRA